jgi:hypothetical protein
MRSVRLGLYACLLGSLAFGAQAIGDVVMNFNSPTLPAGWSTDRYTPAIFQSGVTNAAIGSGQYLEVGLAASDYQGSGSFYDYQGDGYSPLNLSGPYQQISVQLYVDPSWATNNTPVNIGLWGVGTDASNNISAYPIIAYLNNDYDTGDPSAADPTAGYTTPGFYAYDYDGVNNANGDWYYLAPGVAGALNTISFTLNVGSGITYDINGAAVGGLYADTDTTSLASLIIDANNFDADQDYYLDNLSATSVPLPTVPFEAAGLLVVALATKGRWMPALAK